jgi:hypothetical protein
MSAADAEGKSSNFSIYDYMFVSIFSIFCKNELTIDNNSEEVLRNKRKFFNDYLFYLSVNDFINNEISSHSNFEEQVGVMYVLIVAIRDIIIEITTGLKTERTPLIIPQITPEIGRLVTNNIKHYYNPSLKNINSSIIQFYILPRDPVLYLKNSFLENNPTQTLFTPKERTILQHPRSYMTNVDRSRVPAWHGSTSSEQNVSRQDIYDFVKKIDYRSDEIMNFGAIKQDIPTFLAYITDLQNYIKTDLSELIDTDNEILNNIKQFVNSDDKQLCINMFGSQLELIINILSLLRRKVDFLTQNKRNFLPEPWYLPSKPPMNALSIQQNAQAVRNNTRPSNQSPSDPFGNRISMRDRFGPANAFGIQLSGV